jgi:hypothetical protein
MAKSKINQNQKIVVVAQSNPKRPNSKSAQRFALYQTGMTVAEFKAAGGTLADITWDSERKFIALVDEVSNSLSESAAA